MNDIKQRRGGSSASRRGQHGAVIVGAGAARSDLGVSAVLVRPDGVVAAGGPETFEHVATRWFVNPTICRRTS